VLITPHVGGATEAMRPRAMELIKRQAIAMRDGEPLLNVVARG
jgi:phosphoglycerate dehydrogenase-like enzyme